jgi:peptidoglycan hydrolase CwlO-like protein
MGKPDKNPPKPEPVFQGLIGLMEFLRNFHQVTRDLKEIKQLLEENNMKVSEFGTTLTEVQTQLKKVFGEQQSAIDQAKAKIAELEGQLANADAPQEAVDALAALKALVQQVDDQIPDDATPPAGGGDEA